MSDLPVPSSTEFVIYQTEDGQTRIQVRLDGGTIWLTQSQMVELFQTSVPNINMHLKNLFEEGELPPDSVIKDYLITAADGKSYRVVHYNLGAIISVGYRVRSHRGTQFRQWATGVLSEYVVKGFALDDERLKDGRNIGADYFDELLERIRDVRASERRFYQKITDIYATSVDYDSNSPMTQLFFQTVQNKMHWAIHGQTAAEVIYNRVDADKYMKGWAERLDAFLQFNERDILNHAGKIPAELAKHKAEAEFGKYDARGSELEATQPTSDFDKFVERTKRFPIRKSDGE